MPEDGVLDAVGIDVTAIAGSPPQYQVGLVTEGSAESWPTTQPTAYGGSGIALWAPTATGFQWVTLPTAASAQAGDVVSAMIWPGSTAPSGTNNITVRRSYNTAQSQRAILVRYYTTSWTNDGGFPTMAVRYNDGTVALPAVTASLQDSFGSGSSPNERGCVFTLPFSATCVGCRFYHPSTTATGPSVVRLYSAGGTILAEAPEISSARDGFSDVFWDPVTLAANTTYRVARLPTSTTNVALQGIRVLEASHLSWWSDGGRWQRTHRSGTGAWTDVANELYMFALWLTGVSGSGGGPTLVQSGYLA
ncbi:hypothetical protein HRbin23_01671 [bacterium HR23]|nr:hypothetical protein HRbin23_01671 [bacterium HR23]